MKLNRDVNLIGVGGKASLQMCIYLWTDTNLYIENLELDQIDPDEPIGTHCTLTAIGCAFKFGLFGISLSEGASLNLNRCEFIVSSFYMDTMGSAERRHSSTAILMRMNAYYVCITNCRTSGCQKGRGGCIQIDPARGPGPGRADNEQFVRLRCVANTFEECFALPFVEDHGYRSADGDTCWVQDRCVLIDTRLISFN